MMSERDVTAILERLAVIETKIDTLADHERRIRWIEKVSYLALGMATAAGLPQLSSLIP